jgi:hypothetical protein
MVFAQLKTIWAIAVRTIDPFGAQSDPVLAEPHPALAERVAVSVVNRADTASSRLYHIRSPRQDHIRSPRQDRSPMAAPVSRPAATAGAHQPLDQ